MIDDEIEIEGQSYHWRHDIDGTTEFLIANRFDNGINMFESTPEQKAMLAKEN